MNNDVKKTLNKPHYWSVRTTIPLKVWLELQGRGIVKNNLDEFVTEAIIEKLNRTPIEGVKDASST